MIRIKSILLIGTKKTTGQKVAVFVGIGNINLE
jgi:hypothetical protein